MAFYSKQKDAHISSVIEKTYKAMYTKVADLKVVGWTTPEPVEFDDRYEGEKKELSLGQTWGQLWDCGWFHFTGEVPAICKGKKTVLLIDVNGEGCVYDDNGCPIRGITNVSSWFNFERGKPGKRVVQFRDEAEGNEKVDIWIETGCNDLFGNYSKEGTLEEASVAICNEEIRSLYYDFEVLYNLMNRLPEDDARHMSILYSLHEATKVLRDYNEEEAIKARKILKVELDKKGGDPSLSISAIGHAHIDLAWLWPIRETIRKGSRTFSTVLEMMERYPDYKFGASQPQLYFWMKEHYPALYEKIKESVKKDRWEVQGAMWVEPDTNISGAEALVRQVVYGKRFFREEFDKDMKILWLPDVFGYTGALPQILKKSGVDYFMTIKLSWSEHNKFPYHTFNWKGIDGTKILTHMPPQGTYNSSATPKAIKNSEKDFMEKGISDRCLLLYGIGDGGGGPGAEHLERLDRMKNLNGLVPVEQEFALDFFHRIDKDCSKYNTWDGELYLEKHQGTLTSQAANKRCNRKMEIMLRELEFASMLANINNDYVYPQEEIEKIWKEVLLYQFHDILPGSSIKCVYDESVARYKILSEETRELTEKAYSALAEKIGSDGMENPYIIFNSLSWKRNEWINLDGEWKHISVPAMGYVVVDKGESNVDQNGLVATDNTLENELIKVEFAADGTMSSIFDKENNREVIPEGMKGNKLSVYDDDGDAWDFNITYDQKSPVEFVLQSSKSYIDGPRAIIKQTYKYGESELVQDIVLTKDSRRIDFNTKVEWKERNKMLRTSIPVDVHTSEAVCDIQFGSINRPCHRNTSWDAAKHEICAHKWVDLSQRDYGVALMNDCKYGYKVMDNTIDLNLLRSSEFPGVNADYGTHNFTYSIYPHKGDHVTGQVAKEAYELNIPLNSIAGTKNNIELPHEKAFIQIDNENVIIEAIKKAEDDNSLVIRLYENSNSTSNAKIHFGFDVKSVQLVDIMEENPENVSIDEGNVNIMFKPFEIQTLKVEI